MGVTYKDAGVDIERGDALVDRIGPLAKRTHRQGVLAGVGGFGALFSLKDLHRYNDPVLVTGCDGVGTKLKLAFMANEHRTVGIDLVAMSVNDILCHGAEPLFFLDYFATSKLDVEQAAQVIEGIAEGCVQAGCALVGGETAELPGFYTPGEYDLAGFAVGVAERSRLLPRPDVVVGDTLIGLPSSGLHSNGYSLARKLVFDELKLTLDDELPKGAGPVRSTLLAPTKIYISDVLPLLDHVKAIAHITGGGLLDNVPRVLPPNTRAQISPASWPVPKLFSVLQAAANASSTEMYRTFNMGIGLVLVVGAAHVDHVMKTLPQAYKLGSIVAGPREPDCVVE